jgi:hypothetical protein
MWKRLAVFPIADMRGWIQPGVFPLIVGYIAE